MTTSDSTATRDLVATARAITERELKTYAGLVKRSGATVD